jgi:hypothetical protein
VKYNKKPQVNQDSWNILFYCKQRDQSYG